MQVLRMSNYTTQEKIFMINLAKNAIRSELHSAPLSLKPTYKKLREKRACFITIMKNGQLRGCIGHTFPVQELQKDIIENAKSAAFSDPRFPPITEEEIDQIDIEISVLTIPKPFYYKTYDDLLAYLAKVKPGVILSKGYYRATYLPAVCERVVTVYNLQHHIRHSRKGFSNIINCEPCHRAY